jgi:hypothetical protein
MTAKIAREAAQMSSKIVLAALVLAGCSGAGPAPSADGGAGLGNASVSGTVLGETLVAQDAIAEEYLGGSTSPTANVIITNYPGACATSQASHVRPSSLMLDLSLQVDHAAVTARTYSFAAGELKASFYRSDATCKITGASTEAAGSGGSVSISSIADGLTGTFDLTFGTDHVTGSFHAPGCEPGTSSTISCGP